MRALIACIVSAELLMACGGGDSSKDMTTSYEVEAAVDYQTAIVTVSDQIHYANNTRSALDRISFTVVPASRPYGNFQLEGSWVNGRVAEASIGAGDTDGSLDVKLDTPLEPGAAVDIKIKYRLALGDAPDIRLSRSNNIIHLGNWLPTVKAVSGNGWPRDRYIDTGDAFFAEAADYQVRLTVLNTTDKLLLASSGTQSSRTVDGSTVKYAIEGKKMREFALTMSENYQMSSQQVGATKVMSYYLPGQKVEAEAMLQTAAAAVAWGNSHLGTYPYPTLTIAEGSDPEGGGQEYSSMFIVGSGDYTFDDLQYFRYLIAHETYHEWFYWLVGNDQINEPWLDESLATFMGYQYVKSVMPDEFEAIWRDHVIGYYNEGLAAYGYLPLDSSIYEYVDDEHSYTVLYRQGALFHDEVKAILGEEKYYGMIKAYVDDQAGRLSTTDGLLKRVIAALPGDVPWKRTLIRKYFSEQTTDAAFRQ